CPAPRRARRYGHHSHGGIGGIAQRGDGHHRALLRSCAAARGTRPMTVDDAVARLEAARTEALAAIGNASALDALDALEREHLKGRGSAVSEVNEQIKSFAPDDRPRAGQAVGAYRAAVGEALTARRAELEAAAAADTGGRLDLSLGTHGLRR